MSFLVPEDLVEVELEYIDLGKNGLLILRTPLQKEFYLKAEGAVKRLKKIKAKFFRPDWENFNFYIQDTVREDPETSENYLDTIRLRKNKFQVLLKEMLVVEDGKEQPVTLDNSFYKRVSPDLAIALVEKYDEALNEERNNILTELGVFKAMEEQREKEEKERKRLEEGYEEPKKEEIKPAQKEEKERKRLEEGSGKEEIKPEQKEEKKSE